MTWTMGMMMVAGLMAALFVVALVAAVRRTRVAERKDLTVTCVPSKHGPDWVWAVEAPEVRCHGTARTWEAAQRGIRRTERRLDRAPRPVQPEVLATGGGARRAKELCTGCMRDVEDCECTTVGIAGIAAVDPEPVYAPFTFATSGPRRAR